MASAVTGSAQADCSRKRTSHAESTHRSALLMMKYTGKDFQATVALSVNYSSPRAPFLPFPFLLQFDCVRSRWLWPSLVPTNSRNLYIYTSRLRTSAIGYVYVYIIRPLSSCNCKARIVGTRSNKYLQREIQTPDKLGLGRLHSA